MKERDCVFYRWKPAAWLRITGSDALSFLQGQFTNDLRMLGAGGCRSVYGLWLNQKGRVLADSFVLGGAGGAFWVGSYFSPAEVIRTRLEAYIIADDVTVEDCTADWSAVTVFGEAVRPETPGAENEVQLFPGRRSGLPGWEWVYPAAMESAVLASLAGAAEVDGAEMERRRILAGIPAVAGDIGPGDLPNEGGLERTAISFTKGCYLGQEVMARLKSLGQVRRRLVRVRGSGPLPPRAARLLQNGQDVGELRTFVADGDGFVGLAMVTWHRLRGEAVLSLAPNTGPTLTLTDLP